MKVDLNQFSIPSWVRFIAQDSDGWWWGYSVEPLENHRGWYENEVGQNIKLKQTDANEKWRESLVKISVSL